MFGIPKGQVSPLYKGCWGISLRVCLKKVIESRVFLSFFILSAIEQTHHQFVRVAVKYFFRPFDTRFILGDRRLGNLKAPAEKTNLSKGNCEFHKTRLFLQLVIFSSFLIDLIYIGFS